MLTEVLGQGITATVYKCLRREGGGMGEVACKVVNKKRLAVDRHSREMLAKQLKNEIGLLCRLNHPNVVRLEEVIETDDKMYIMMEMLPGGELFDHIIEKGTLSEKDAANIIKQVACGLAYCHKNGVVHRDLKPENLLLGCRDAGRELECVKIADFGFSKAMGGNMQTFIGTPGYLAPELRQGTEYTGTVDVFALGVIMYVLLCGRLPFAAETTRIAQGNAHAQEAMQLDFPAEEFGHVSMTAKSLMWQMMQIEPSARISAEQILESPWICGGAADVELTKTAAGLRQMQGRGDGSLTVDTSAIMAKQGRYSMFCDSPRGRDSPRSPASANWRKSSPGLLKEPEAAQGRKSPTASKLSWASDASGSDGASARGSQPQVLTQTQIPLLPPVKYTRRAARRVSETDKSASAHKLISPTETVRLPHCTLRFAGVSQRGFDPTNASEMTKPNSDHFVFEPRLLGAANRPGQADGSTMRARLVSSAKPSTASKLFGGKSPAKGGQEANKEPAAGGGDGCNVQSESALFMVLDGHGETGRRCARFLADEIHKGMTKQMRVAATAESVVADQERQSRVSNAEQELDHVHDSATQRWEDVFHHANEELHKTPEVSASPSACGAAAPLLLVL
jgi:serine/threonine protein kinase